MMITTVFNSTFDISFNPQFTLSPNTCAVLSQRTLVSRPLLWPCFFTHLRHFLHDCVLCVLNATPSLGALCCARLRFTLYALRRHHAQFTRDAFTYYLIFITSYRWSKRFLCPMNMSLYSLINMQIKNILG